MNVYWIDIECTLNTHYVYIEYTLNVHWIHIECTLNTHWNFAKHGAILESIARKRKGLAISGSAISGSAISGLAKYVSQSVSQKRFLLVLLKLIAKHGAIHIWYLHIECIKYIKNVSFWYSKS